MHHFSSLLSTSGTRIVDDSLLTARICKTHCGVFRPRPAQRVVES